MGVFDGNICLFSLFESIVVVVDIVFDVIVIWVEVIVYVWVVIDFCCFVG